MANVNNKYSDSTITDAQRSKFDPLTTDGAWASAWSGTPDSVENAHDQQNAPTYPYVAPVAVYTDAKKPPVADR